MPDLSVSGSILLESSTSDDLTISKLDMQLKTLSQINFGSGSTNLNGEISFKTIDPGLPDNLVERMRIHTNGYVGIGTDEPEFPLHIPEEGLQIGTSPDAYNNFYLVNEHDPNLNSRTFRLYHKSENTNLLTVASLEGRVGIGIKTPRNKLDIKGNTVIGTRYAGLCTAPADGLLVEGNVGIGIQAPEAKLHIKQEDIHWNSGIRINNGTNDWAILADGQTRDDITKWLTIAPYGDYSKGVVIKDGDVGIGTMEPNYSLDVNRNGSPSTIIQRVWNKNTSWGAESLVRGYTDLYNMDYPVADWGFYRGTFSDGDSGFIIKTGTVRETFTRFKITKDGNVGIGTASADKLGSNGNLIVEGNIGTHGWSPNPRKSTWGGGIHTWDVEAEGTMWSMHGYQSGPRDLAENYPSDMNIEPGDVVCLDRDKDGIIISEKPNNSLVLGVVSTAPGFLLNAEFESGKAFPVALSGRVPCKVVDENGPIKRGDLLTSSSTPGHAMKASPIKIKGEELFRPGTIIGKALDILESGKGVIDIFVFSS